MKNLTPRTLALASALAVALIVSLLTAIFVFLSSELSPFYTVLLIGTLTFFSAYLVFIYTVNNFIYRKIKLIYKTIHNLKSGNSGDVKKPDVNKDLLSEVDKEVMVWAQDRTSEIEDLRRLEAYRREFLGNVSHELKTPVFNIQGYIMTLLDGGLNDPAINVNYLQRAEKSVERMITIIDDLEAISRLESGELTLEVEKFDIVDLVKEVFDAQELKASAKKITLRFRDNYSRGLKVLGDKEKIRQVITNLIVNSIKYGKEGGVTEVRFYDMDENALIEVSDNGIGIGKEHLPRLFERFYRVDKGRSRDQGGTGLGLAIVKHIIEAHDQTVNVRSTEGVGSTFAFTLGRS